MSRFYPIVTALIIVCGLLVLPVNLQAAGTDATNSIFKFQHRLAERGNIQAQYKLAAMYEIGIGTSIDKVQADHWYGVAAASGLTAAAHRQQYLKIKQQGFKPAMDASWLDEIKKESAADNAEATYLLAQLYREGIGVKRDRYKALEMFNQISVFDVPYVDRDIEGVQAEIAARKTRLKQKVKKSAVASKAPVAPVAAKTATTNDSAEPQAGNSKIAGTVAKNSQAKLEQEKAQQIKAEKRRRYEKAMLQIKLEQQQIDELQASMSDGQAVGIDEEF